MKKKVLLSSILTIALCFCIIVGSTYALFTSESTVKVAATSGTLDVTATVDNISYTSTLGTTLPESAATFDDQTNEVTIQYMVPGDVIKFDIILDNNSTNVSFNYRTVITKLADDGLWSGLVVKIDGVVFTGDSAVTSAWTSVAANAWTDKTISVEITLPESSGNEYQTKTCSFSYMIEAIQANAPTA